MTGEGGDIQNLRDDFRDRLGAFYASLKLAPPYHSIEKAVAHLAALLKSLPPGEHATIRTNPEKQWALYSQAFVESGLNQKHRGIIIGLIQSRQMTELPVEYQHFLAAFRS